MQWVQAAEAEAELHLQDADLGDDRTFDHVESLRLHRRHAARAQLEDI